GGVPTWLGAHAVPPEFPDADAYLDFALTEVLPEAARLAEAADVFVERGAFDAAQARRYLTACRDAGLVLRLHGDQFTEQGAIPGRGPRRVHGERRARPRPCGEEGSHRRRVRRRPRPARRARLALRRLPPGREPDRQGGARRRATLGVSMATKKQKRRREKD